MQYAYSAAEKVTQVTLYSVKTLPLSGHSNASWAQLAVCCQSERSFIAPGACRLNHAILWWTW